MASASRTGFGSAGGRPAGPASPSGLPPGASSPGGGLSGVGVGGGAALAGRAVKKLTISNFKVPPQLPADFADTMWAKLQGAVRAIQQQRAANASNEELYRGAGPVSAAARARAAAQPPHSSPPPPPLNPHPR